MVSVDEQIQLAKQISEQLPEVTRNEWMRWMQVANQRGLDYAIRYAERLSTDPTMRPAIRRANRLIARGVRSHQKALAQLNGKERKATLGYVGWLLKIGTLRGALRS